MKHYLLILTTLCALISTTNILAIDESLVQEMMQTDVGLYFTPDEAKAYITKNPGNTLFIDVRDPAELHTVGMPASADANVPFLLLDTSTWDSNRQKFGMKPNTEFSAEIKMRLDEKSLNENDTIVLICGSGVRSARAVNALHEMGYKQLYSVVTGFKGWQKDKLGIDNKLDQKKMYGTPE
jgi:rhodanese-related sulfurtransferase